VQLAAILLKELVYCPDTDSNLTESHVALLLVRTSTPAVRMLGASASNRARMATLQEAYNAVVEKVKQRLNGSLGGIFLQLFEEEMSKYRRTIISPLLCVVCPF
jgi:hypothetical protein